MYSGLRALSRTAKIIGLKYHTFFEMPLATSMGAPPNYQKPSFRGQVDASFVPSEFFGLMTTVDIVDSSDVAPKLLPTSLGLQGTTASCCV